MAWSLKLDELIKATKGEQVSCVVDSWSGFSTDTREDLGGKVFFALKGDQFDGHSFLKEAISSGASALLVHTDVPVEISQQVTVVSSGGTLS